MVRAGAQLHTRTESSEEVVFIVKRKKKNMVEIRLRRILSMRMDQHSVVISVYI